MMSLLLVSTLGALFWQPWMDSGSREPRRELTEKEKYIQKVQYLIDRREYKALKGILENPLYPKEELPWEYWKQRISLQREELGMEMQRIHKLKGLERILKGLEKIFD